MSLRSQVLRHSCISQLAGRAQHARRQLAGQSPRAFAEVYLDAHCRLPFSRMHEELFDILAQIAEKRGARLAVAAPRGHAKSTVASLAYVLWGALCGREKHILIVSATAPQAVQLMRDVKKELSENSQLQMDFADILRPRRSPNRANKFLVGDVMISAYGAGQGLRGAKHGHHRPSLIIVDDVENTEQVIQEEQRAKLREWFDRTLLKAGDAGTNVVVVGTVLHHDSLLAHLVDPTKGHGWRGYKYQAVEHPPDRPELWDKWSAIYRNLEDFKGQTGPEAAEAFYRANAKKMLAGTAVLWPELEDYHALMVVREREGRHSFQAEKQNEPVDPEQCVFDESTFQYWDDEFRDVQHLVEVAKGDEWGFCGACDPSLGKRRGDYTAIVILLKNHKTKIHYVIAADLLRIPPAKAIDRIVQYATMYRIGRFAVEANQFQALLLENLRKRIKEAGISMSIGRIENRTNKEARIAALEPLVSQGSIRFHRRQRQLLDQLRQFPLGAHDDGPDALEMAVKAARRIHTDVVPVIHTTRPRY